MALSAAAWFGTAGNQFSGRGFFAWAASLVILWRLLDRPGPPHPPAFPISRATGAGLVVILLGATALRFAALSSYPPDMTSDHVEKLLDVQRILDGDRPVFMGNNGGRESLHFYGLALLAKATGQPLDFDLLKAGSGLVGLLGVLASFWLGRILAGDDGSAFADGTGLLCAALVSVSWWHVMLSRLGLRIVWTPFFVCLLAGFLARALRTGRRRAYLAAGLTVGFGLYAYQALRMAPVFVTLGGLAALFLARPAGGTRAMAAGNFAALVALAAATAVPLARYAHDAPAVFWARTKGRILGDDAVSAADRHAALRSNLSRLGSNAARAAGMLHVSGDRAWITGAPQGPPQVDRLTGVLLAAGFAGLAVRLVRRRDPGDALVLLGLPVMLLPTALALARPSEVPSATRASGALPFALFLAAWAGAHAIRLFARRAGAAPAVSIVALGLAVSAPANAHIYFGPAMDAYRSSTFPYAEAGAVLGAFGRVHGAPGNAFMVGAPNWWDHRALAFTSGFNRWDNGVLPDPLFGRLDEKVRTNAGTPLAVRPEAPLLFFVSPDDTGTLDRLRTKFPEGRLRRIHTSRPGRDYLLLYVDSPLLRSGP
ncbi:MAG TPA: hypothetical protein PLB01_02545 [Thermoanaerobaculia bacterium]|nr:hypothetical protein [Thermoanaerobaculia bacterium]